jgi:hypothetical protein
MVMQSAAVVVVVVDPGAVVVVDPGVVVVVEAGAQVGWHPRQVVLVPACAGTLIKGQRPGPAAG